MEYVRIISLRFIEIWPAYSNLNGSIYNNDNNNTDTTVRILTIF
jgi:hypothetical protein